MADWFETRFREPVDSGPLDPAFVARMRALVTEEWQADAGTTPPDFTDTDEQGRNVIMLETEDYLTGHEPVTRRRRSPGRWLVAAAAIVVAAASIAITAEDPSRVATAPTTPTASQAGTTTEQYGSVVSEHSAAIQEWIDTEEASDHVEDGFNQYLRERYVPFRRLLVNFDQALAELPSPPDEIATLVDRTKAAVNDSLNSVERLLTCTAAWPSRYCGGDERSAAEAAYNRLPPVFAAWSPYT
jgi:hypothetical protein